MSIGYLMYIKGVIRTMHVIHSKFLRWEGYDGNVVYSACGCQIITGIAQ